MAYFEVYGGRPLSGEITPQGAKNEALQIICATLLTKERVVLHNVPEIVDVLGLIDLMRNLGVEVERLGEGEFALCARNIDLGYLRTEDYKLRGSKLRGSVMVVGPLLARFGVAYMPKPGGDKIGRRRLDTHFIGLKKLGAEVNFDLAGDFFEIAAPNLQGTYILLDEASVTGTANIIMAAVMAKGTTTIYNAACEPYIQQLCKMLCRMGAKIEGIASNLLRIEGVEELHATEHTMLPDMIEVGSFIGMAAMTQSELTIKNVSFENLGIIPAQFARMGIRFEQRGDDIYIPRQEHYEIESFMDGSIMN
ncbi:MAG: UDP-N-acetylglucosamine 1-carboxyvinyltransferase, partial [Tidjanibacter sp.]|nr:UDP-N-acetylglucosamine 1-carboxyvinyltransferase [Tidjanibacter sp.]